MIPYHAPSSGKSDIGENLEDKILHLRYNLSFHSILGGNLRILWGFHP